MSFDAGERRSEVWDGGLTGDGKTLEQEDRDTALMLAIVAVAAACFWGLCLRLILGLALPA